MKKHMTITVTVKGGKRQTKKVDLEYLAKVGNPRQALVAWFTELAREALEETPIQL